MSSYQKLDENRLQNLQDMANKLRIHSIKATDASNSGHPTSCCSIAEIISVLFFEVMKYKPNEPRDPSSDRFVLSKGHAAPILYAAWSEVGYVDSKDLSTLRKVDSDLEGHPTPRLDFVDVATGSLGQGLSCAAGMAYTGKYFDKASYRVYCLLGDGESAEGSVWEAVAFAGFYKLDNLVAIIDVNRLGQSDPTMLQHDTHTYKKRLEAFGWHSIMLDGHDVAALCVAFHECSTVKDKPSVIIAKTFKGRGILDVEDQLNFHGKALGSKSAGSLESISNTIINECFDLKPTGVVKDDAVPIAGTPMKMPSPPEFTKGKQVPTREAYGTALARLGSVNKRIVALDGDMKNSTFSNKFLAIHPERFIECFIAEQNMVGVAVGCSTRGRTVPFVSTFACFLSRAYDQIRMAAISFANVKFCGSHAGISIGDDGPSQMGLEDIAMFRAIPDAVVFYPSDAVACENAVELAANYQGIAYIRTTRSATPVVYGNDTEFQIGKLKVVRESNEDVATVIAAGITLPEAMKAADLLMEDKISIRVLDPFTLKPLDEAGLLHHVRATHGHVITVEDHYAEGGMGDAIAGALCQYRDVSLTKLAVTALPRSGNPAALLDKFGISSKHIVQAVKNVIH